MHYTEGTGIKIAEMKAILDSLEASEIAEGDTNMHPFTDSKEVVVECMEC